MIACSRHPTDDPQVIAIELGAARIREPALTFSH